MKKQDWLEYVSYLRRLIGIENNRKTDNVREECMKNYNLSMLYNDLSNAKIKIRKYG